MSAELPDLSDPSDKALSSALTAWLGPIAGQVTETADLDDDALDQALKKGLHIQPGSSSQMETLSYSEMRQQYGNQNKG